MMSISMYERTLLLAFATAAISLNSPSVFAQASGGNCTALVQAKNNLWLARQDGSVIRQITNDTQARSAAAISPNATLIAYSGNPGASITVIDASGRTVTNVPLAADDPIIDLKWSTQYLVTAEEHYSRDNSRFHFIDFSSGNSAPTIYRQIVVGTQCALAPNARDTACTTAGAELSLNDRTIYRAPDGFADSLPLQTVNMASGTSLMTSTSPPFRVEFKGMSRSGRMTLRVTSPDGLWTEQSVSAGGQLVMQFEDASHPLSDYAFKPSTTNPGVIRLDVKKSLSGESSFEGDLAWDSRGKRLAFVVSTRLGQRTLVVLNRQLGEAANQGIGGIDFAEPLPLAGPVRSIRFTSDTHIRVVGATQQFDQDIPAHGKVANSKVYSLTPALPVALDVNFPSGRQTAVVKGWACD